MPKLQVKQKAATIVSRLVLLWAIDLPSIVIPHSCNLTIDVELDTEVQCPGRILWGAKLREDGLVKQQPLCSAGQLVGLL